MSQQSHDRISTSVDRHFVELYISYMFMSTSFKVVITRFKKLESSGFNTIINL